MAKRLDVGALLSGTVSKMDTGSSMQVQDIALDMLDESPDNSYSQHGIDELAESISVIGVQQPLVVQALDGGRYQVIAGHRRRNALALLGRATAPCIVLSADLDPALLARFLHSVGRGVRGARLRREKARQHGVVFGGDPQESDSRQRIFEDVCDDRLASRLFGGAGRSDPRGQCDAESDDLVRARAVAESGDCRAGVHAGAGETDGGNV